MIIVNNIKIKSLVYKTVLLTISAIATFMTFYNLNGNTFMYYTLLSNLCVFGFTIAVWVFNLKEVLAGDYTTKNKHLVGWKGIAILCITITGVIYATLLANYTKKTNYSFLNLAHHYIIPVMFVADYFLFDEKGLIKWYHPLVWVGVSVLYYPYIFIRAAILGKNTTLKRYPYFFMDYDAHSLGYVIGWAVAIVLVFGTVAVLFYVFDRKRK